MFIFRSNQHPFTTSTLSEMKIELYVNVLNHSRQLNLKYLVDSSQLLSHGVGLLGGKACSAVNLGGHAQKVIRNDD